MYFGQNYPQITFIKFLEYLPKYLLLESITFGEYMASIQHYIFQFQIHYVLFSELKHIEFYEWQPIIQYSDQKIGHSLMSVYWAIEKY